MSNIIIMSEKRIEYNCAMNEKKNWGIPTVEAEMYKVYDFLKNNPQLFEESEIHLNYEGIYFIALKKDFVYEFSYKIEDVAHAVMTIKNNDEITYKKNIDAGREKRYIFKEFTSNFFYTYYQKTNKKTL